MTCLRRNLAPKLFPCLSGISSSFEGKAPENSRRRSAPILTPASRKKRNAAMLQREMRTPLVTAFQQTYLRKTSAKDSLGVLASPSAISTGWAGPRSRVSVVLAPPAVTDETTEVFVAAAAR